MRDIWIMGVYAAVLASIPAHLRNQLEPREGGSQCQQTHALPVVAGDKQYALICYYKSDGPVYGKMPKIYPPFACVNVSYPNKETHWADVKPEALGLINLPITEDKVPYLGTLERGVISMQEWRSANDRYDVLISLVFERHWLVTRHAVTKEERATAQELQDCTRILYDKPLLPYYQHNGRQFLAWMERAAK